MSKELVFIASINDNHDYSFFIIVIIQYYCYTTSSKNSSSTNNNEDDNFLTYKNDIYAIRIQYPSDWEKVDFNQKGNKLNIVVIFRSPAENASDTKLENLVVQVGNLPYENISLAKVGSANINSLNQSLIDFELNESTIITVAGGNPAHKVVYTERERNSEQSKTMQVLMIKK